VKGISLGGEGVLPEELHSWANQRENERGGVMAARQDDEEELNSYQALVLRRSGVWTSGPPGEKLAIRRSRHEMRERGTRLRRKGRSPPL